MTRNKVIGWTVAIFLIWFVISSPQAAAHALAYGLLPALKSVGNSLATFFTSL